MAGLPMGPRGRPGRRPGRRDLRTLARARRRWRRWPPRGAGGQRGDTFRKDVDAAAHQRFGGDQEGAQDLRDQLAGERAGAALVDLHADENDKTLQRLVRLVEDGGDRGVFFRRERVRLHAAQYGMGSEGVASIWVIFV